jgi:hypothetical protein
MVPHNREAIVLTSLNVTGSGGSSIGLIYSAPYARIAGLVSNISSVTLRHQMAADSSGVFQVSSSVVINSGGGVVDLSNFGHYSQFSILLFQFVGVGAEASFRISIRRRDFRIAFRFSLTADNSLARSMIVWRVQIGSISNRSQTQCSDPGSRREEWIHSMAARWIRGASAGETCRSMPAQSKTARSITFHQSSSTLIGRGL